MTISADFFLSFRSPYSYLAVKRIIAIEQDYDVKINARPVYPIAIRMKGWLSSRDPRMWPYFLNDAHRSAEMLGLPLKFPGNPDPVVMDVETREAAAEQPYIHRITRMGCAAETRGKGLAYMDQVCTMIHGGLTPDWHLGEHLEKAVAAAGLNLADLDAEISAGEEKFDKLIEANEALQQPLHWGVPLMVVNGEAFFGQDRCDQFRWRIAQLTKERAS